MSREEHTPVIERFYQVLEKQYRYYYAILLSKYLLREIVVELCVVVMFYVNTFMRIKIISSIQSLLTIIEGTVLDYTLHFKVIYGEFFQTYKEIKNNMSLEPLML